MTLAAPFPETTRREDGTIVVDARSLHRYLKVASCYAEWIARAIRKHGLSEGKDFVARPRSSPHGRPATDHEITLENAMALAACAKGKVARQASLRLKWKAEPQAETSDLGKRLT